MTDKKRLGTGALIVFVIALILVGGQWWSRHAYDHMVAGMMKTTLQRSGLKVTRTITARTVFGQKEQYRVRIPTNFSDPVNLVFDQTVHFRPWGLSGAWHLNTHDGVFKHLPPGMVVSGFENKANWNADPVSGRISSVYRESVGTLTDNRDGFKVRVSPLAFRFTSDETGQNETFDFENEGGLKLVLLDSGQALFSVKGVASHGSRTLQDGHVLSNGAMSVAQVVSWTGDGTPELHFKGISLGQLEQVRNGHYQIKETLRVNGFSQGGLAKIKAGQIHFELGHVNAQALDIMAHLNDHLSGSLQEREQYQMAQMSKALISLAKSGFSLKVHDTYAKVRGGKVTAKADFHLIPTVIKSVMGPGVVERIAHHVAGTADIHVPAAAIKALPPLADALRRFEGQGIASKADDGSVSIKIKVANGVLTAGRQRIPL